MKKITLIILLLLTLISCEKEYYIHRSCYDIPDNKVISTGDLVEHRVDIEWSTNTDDGQSYSTKVVQRVDMDRQVYALEINGRSSNDGHFYPSDTNLFVSLIVWKDTINDNWIVHSMKPMFWDMNIWNSSSTAPIGVTENDSLIVVYSQNIEGTTTDETMCVKLTIYK